MNFMKLWGGTKSGDQDWMEQMLAVNPWARGLTIKKENKDFEEAQQRATLDRWAEGPAAWNAWANAMLALRKELEKAGDWTANGKSRAMWDALSTAVFSTESNSHTFEIDFLARDCLFCGEAWFDNATFSNAARFEGAAFSSTAWFDNAKFSGDAGFNGVKFSGYARFLGTIFTRSPEFTGATFSDVAWFEGARFSGDAEFTVAEFSGEARFNNVTVTGAALFGNATFASAAKFDNATFSRAAVFSSAKFSGDAGFNSARFGDSANFPGTTFSGEAQFTGVTFSGNAWFNTATFSRDAKFERATFSRAAGFNGCIFEEGAYLNAIESQGAFSLADATFNRVPSLLGATFRGALRLDDVQTPRYRLLGWTPDRDAPARFRELKRRAHEAQDRDRELEFFAQEIRTSRFHARGKLPAILPRVWEWRFWFGLLYGTFSDFGRSFFLPVVFWSILFAFSAVLYLGENEALKQTRAVRNPHRIWESSFAYAVTTRDAWSNPPACVPKSDSNADEFAATNAVNEALYLALKNGLVVGVDVGRSDTARRIYGCLYGLARDAAQSPIIPLRVSLISTAQTLASGVLILLFFLAVRNLLRLK